METVLYADVLFAVNFSMDFISLAAAAALGGRQKQVLRLCLASALGAVYGVSAIVSGVSGWLQYLLAAATGAAMCVIGFGLCGGLAGFIRQSILIWGCGALLGGIMTAVINPGRHRLSASELAVPAAASVAVVYFIIRAICARRGCRSVEVLLELRGKKHTFSALCDSGNLLRDPFSGKPVILASAAALRDLLTDSELTAFISCDAAALAGAGLRIRLIPRKCSGEASLCAAFIPDSAVIKKGKRTLRAGCLIAVADRPADYFGGFSATAPYALIP